MSFVEFGEAVFGVELRGEAHLDDERLHLFGEVAAGPVFLFDLFAPGVDGEFLEFFEDLGRGFLREDFFAGKFGDGAVGVFGFADFDADESLLAAAPEEFVARLGACSAEHVLRNGRVQVDPEFGFGGAGAQHAEGENRVGRLGHLQADDVLVRKFVGVPARCRQPVGEGLEQLLAGE